MRGVRILMGMGGMIGLRDIITGPWRAVPVLGVTQILSWGTIFYTPVLIVPLIAAGQSHSPWADSR